MSKKNIARMEISSDSESFFVTDEDFALVKNERVVKEEAMEVKRKIGSFYVNKIELKSNKKSKSPLLYNASGYRRQPEDPKEDLNLTKKLISSFQTKPKITYGLLKTIDECSEFENEEGKESFGRRKRQGRRSRWSNAIGSRERQQSQENYDQNSQNNTGSYNFDLGLNDIVITKKERNPSPFACKVSKLIPVEGEIIPEVEEEIEVSEREDRFSDITSSSSEPKDLSLNTSRSSIKQPKKEAQIMLETESEIWKPNEEEQIKPKIDFARFSFNFMGNQKEKEERKNSIIANTPLINKNQRTKSLSKSENPVVSKQRNTTLMPPYQRKSIKFVRKRSTSISMDSNSLVIPKNCKSTNNSNTKAKRSFKQKRKKNTISVNEVVKSYLNINPVSPKKSIKTEYKTMKKILLTDEPFRSRYGVAKSIDFGKRCMKKKKFTFEDKVKDKVKSQQFIYQKLAKKKRHYSGCMFNDLKLEHLKGKSVKKKKKNMDYEQYVKIKRKLGSFNDSKFKDKAEGEMSKSRVKFGESISGGFKAESKSLKSKKRFQIRERGNSSQ